MGEPVGLAKGVVQVDFSVLVAAKAVCLSWRDSRLVVESLGGAVGEEAASGKPGEQFTPMGAQRAGELLEGLHAAAARAGDPARRWTCSLDA